jgi:hypothetical protein
MAQPYTSSTQLKDPDRIQRRTVLLHFTKETKYKAQYKEAGDGVTVQTVYLPKELLGHPFPSVIEVEVRWI